VYTFELPHMCSAEVLPIAAGYKGGSALTHITQAATDWQSSHGVCCHLQVTAWIPLLDVDVGNGCMQLLAGGHRSGRTAAHTGAVGDTW
jgi:ectoine hydroxylase-related dioxygenase (phytanoyl-CoA dioxygenase family)